jgi:hypothetical protein
MHPSFKKLLILFGPSVVFLLLMIILVYNKHSAQHEPTPLEIKMAQIRLGTSVEDADAIIGTPPDLTKESRGVIVNSTMLLDETNPKSASYGPPQDYLLRTWKGEEVSVTVVFDLDGKSVCHWSWWNNLPPQSPYGPYRVFDRVGLF